MKKLFRIWFLIFFIANPLFAHAQTVAGVAYKLINPTYLLHPGDTLTTNNGQFFLTLQASDGNSVIYENGTMRVMWTNNTLGANLLAFQSDGNFVAYNGNNPLWYSRTVGPVADKSEQMYFFDNGVIAINQQGAFTWATDASFLQKLQHPSSPTCSTARQYAACVFPGTFNQFDTFFLACSAADAQRQAAATGASLGRCN